MKIFITGICGFVGSSLASWFREHQRSVSVHGMDNFIRPGSETNRLKLKALGVSVRHGDVRNASDFETLPDVDWVFDAAANPSVLAGVDGNTSTRQLVEHNLLGTVNILEYCRRIHAGFVLLSTSRVYSIPTLVGLPLVERDGAFCLDETRALPEGVSPQGITVDCPTTAPISLYGATKLASETLAIEYGSAFSLPIWINRCGVIAGAGQFGTAEQGIFSYWIHAFVAKRPLRYCGFGGKGLQVRDALHPSDIADLIWRQINYTGSDMRRIFNAGGGSDNAMSLAQLTQWCTTQFGAHTVTSDPSQRQFDVPWYVTDNHQATDVLGWRPQQDLESILMEISELARQCPGWLTRCDTEKS